MPVSVRDLPPLGIHLEPEYHEAIERLARQLELSRVETVRRLLLWASSERETLPWADAPVAGRDNRVRGKALGCRVTPEYAAILGDLRRQLGLRKAQVMRAIIHLAESGGENVLRQLDQQKK